MCKRDVKAFFLIPKGIVSSMEGVIMVIIRLKSIHAKWALLYILISSGVVLTATLFNLDGIMLAVLLMCIGIGIYCCNDIRKRSMLLGFVLSFFTFLVGRQFMDSFGIHKIESQAPTLVNQQSEIILFLSIIFLIMGYLITDCFIVNNNSEYHECSISDPYCLSVRNTCKILYILTYAFMCISLFEIVVYVAASSYVDYYVSFHTRLPFIVGKLADMCPIFFFVYLATMPSKKESMKYIFFYTLYLLLTLLTGRRYEFVGGLLIIFVYFTARDRFNIDKNVWFGRREIFIVIISVVSIIVLSTIVGRTRIGAQEELNDSNLFVNFFYQQGISINVLKRTIQYQDYLHEGRLYMFGSTITLLRRLLGLETFYGNTIENAKYGYSLAHSLSYVVLRNQYLSGRGMGSSYVAEAFYSLGYVGVAFANFFYGCILNKFSLFKTESIWKNALILIMLHSIFLAPRSSFDEFIADILRFNTWGTLLIIVFVSKVLYAKKNKQFLTKELV